MASLAEIRARLAASEGNKAGGNQSTGGDNSIYPHWNMEEGASANLRFLPDANPKNTFFWQERAMIRSEEHTSELQVTIRSRMPSSA